MKPRNLLLSASLIACAIMLASSASAQAPPAEQPVPVVTATPAAPPAPAVPTIGPGREIKVGDHFAFRVGLQAQVWANTVQDSSPTMMAVGEDGYQNQIYLRRVRLMTGVKPWDNIDLFVLVEGSDLGKTNADGTAKNTAFNVLDAYGEITFHPAFIFTVGNQLVPIARNILQGTTTYLGLDIGNTSAATFAPGNPLQTATLRDAGIQVKGTVLADRFEYRLGVFSGIRESAVTTTPDVMSTAAENAPRFAGYLQYNFLDPDKGYVFNGTYYGKKRILGLSVGGDYQKGTNLEAYRAYSGAAFAAIPIFGANKTGADEIAALAQFIHYDGKQTAPTLLEQNDFLLEAAYYNKATKLSVFGKLEGKWLVDNEATPADETIGNILWFGGGVKYHLVENLCNFTLAYNRMQLPNIDEMPQMPGDARTSTNQFTFAAQVLYY
jgi:hypothetical protein